MTRARRAKLIVDNMPRVAKIAREVARDFAPHLAIEDFIQAGMVGLCQAARRCSRISTFAGFSYFRIRGAMIDAHNRKAFREEMHTSLEGMHSVRGVMAAGRFEYLGSGNFDRAVNERDRDMSPLPDEQAARRQLAAIAYRAIEDLPPDERYVLQLAVDGVKVTAIAESCGRSLNWTRVRLGTAREKVAAAVAGKAAVPPAMTQTL